VGYSVYRNGVQITAVFGGVTTYSDTQLTSNTTYAYSVSAFDSSGNNSARCTEVSETTLNSSTKVFGTAINDYGRGVAVDSSGNVYVTGWTQGDLDGISNLGGGDIFLMRYNSDGSHAWTNLLGTLGVAEPTATDYGSFGLNVAVDGSGNIYVTGYTTGTMDGQTNSGGKDAFLVKFDSSGIKQWTRLWGASSDDVGTSVAVDSSGNAYITGSTTNAGTEDIFLVKYNSSGVFQWVEQLGTSATDIGLGIAIDQVGGTTYAYVTGGTQGNLDGQSNVNPGTFDIFLTAYNVTGSTHTKQWTHLLGTSTDDAGLGITARGGGVWVTGFTSAALDGNTHSGGNDIFVARYSYLGVKQWTTQLGTTSDEMAFGIAVDSIGNSYVTGFTSGSLGGQFTNPNAGNEDIFLVKFGIGGGTPFWARLLGTSGDDEGRSVALDSSGHVYVVGFTQDNLDGQTNAGGFDACLIKYDTGGNLL